MKLTYIIIAFSCFENTGYNCECKEAEPIFQGTGVFAEAIKSSDAASASKIS